MTSEYITIDTGLVDRPGIFRRFGAQSVEQRAPIPAEDFTIVCDDFSKLGIGHRPRGVHVEPDVTRTDSNVSRVGLHPDHSVQLVLVAESERTIHGTS